MDGVGLGDHYDTAGVLVQPVHDAGTLRGAYRAQLFVAMMKQSVDQGVFARAVSGMNHHARWFVDDNKAFVLVKNPDGQIDGTKPGNGFRGKIDKENFTRIKFLLGFQTVTVLASHFSTFNEALNGCPTYLGVMCRENLVGPIGSRVFGNNESLFRHDYLSNRC